MANFAILRTQKLKHLNSVRRSFKHAFREQDTPNADSSKSGENDVFGAKSTKEAMAMFTARLPEKRRKDAVLAIEYMVTGSPEAIHGKTKKEQQAYFVQSLKWLRERHGRDNVICGGVHFDETTPHMYCYVIPLDKETGRLNCRKWLGGAEALNEMQTDFADNVGKDHGLVRGSEGKKTKHVTIKKYYAELEDTKKTLHESSDKLIKVIAEGGSTLEKTHRVFKSKTAAGMVKIKHEEIESTRKSPRKIER